MILDPTHKKTAPRFEVQFLFPTIYRRARRHLSLIALLYDIAIEDTHGGTVDVVVEAAMFTAAPTVDVELFPFLEGCAVGQLRGSIAVDVVTALILLLPYSVIEIQVHRFCVLLYLNAYPLHGHLVVVLDGDVDIMLEFELRVGDTMIVIHLALELGLVAFLATRECQYADYQRDGDK